MLLRRVCVDSIFCSGDSDAPAGRAGETCGSNHVLELEGAVWRGPVPVSSWDRAGDNVVHHTPIVMEC